METFLIAFAITLFLILVAAVGYLVHLSTPSPEPKSESGEVPVAEPTPVVETNTVTLPGGMVTVALPAKSRRLLPSVNQGHAAESAGDWAAAADVWRSRGDFIRERLARIQADDHLRASELEIALGYLDQAIERLRYLVGQRPDSEVLRLRLLQSYLDRGRVRDAIDLVPAEGQESASLSAQFLADAGRAFEAAVETEMAVSCYHRSMALDAERDEIELRLAYLAQMSRLSATKSSSEVSVPSAKLMEILARESTTDAPRPAPDATGDDSAIAPVPTVEFSGHEILVGHLALGGYRHEARASVRSRASLAGRFRFKRLVGERPASAVFEGVDQLLDCPVALKLSRIPTAPGEFEKLRDRIRAISTINHPNLTKLTFADRMGNVVRLVTEYHTGGSLVTLIRRMETIGLPLMLRLMIQITSGVTAAHRAGVIHGDLRAENVMIGHDQLIKIMDFSLQPFPVRHPKSPDTSSTRGDAIDPLRADEVQTDVGQFADLLDFILARTVAPPPVADIAGNSKESIEELHEVAKRCREGAFSTFSPIQAIFERLLDGMPHGRH